MIKDPVLRKIADKESRPFVGVDGEGGNVPEPGALFGDSHEYLLLRAGDQVLETGAPLTWGECLKFLADLDPGFTYVSYYFDYDVTMMLRKAPLPALKRLFAKRDRISSSERIGNYDVSYTPHKEFKVRHRRAGSPKFITISDVGPFFQCSFVKALTQWDIGTPEVRGRIAADKARRSEFREMTGQEREYNREEVSLLEELMQEFAEACYTVGYIPARWQGPGWLATAIMRAHDVPRSKDLPITSNRLLMKLANEAYYGGRFEITCVGPVAGPVYEYDINSAYPHAMATVLPCLRHGSWIKQSGRPAPNVLGFGQVSFDHPGGMNLCNLPIRTKEGGLTFPRRASGVYWSIELDAAEQAGTEILSTGTWYIYRPGELCTCTPFSFVRDLYAERRRIGKDGRGRVLKLGLNSLYGKMAQSIGMPAYSNPVYASLITANTRAMIIDAYRADPDAVVAIATDAVYSRTPLALDCGEDLGQWERTILDDGMFNVMPGMYYSGSMAGATRGVPLPSFQGAEAEFIAAFEDLKAGKPRTVRIDGTGFITIRQALAWNKPHLAGRWLPNPKDISFDWKSKRDPGFAVLTDGILWTRPQPGSETLVSCPYNRSIGGWADEREWSREQPDYSTWFLPG